MHDIAVRLPESRCKLRISSCETGPEVLSAQVAGNFSVKRRNLTGSRTPEPMENWKEALDGIVYDPTVVEITKLGIAGVVGQELGRQGWKTITSAPEASGPVGAFAQISDEAIREAVKEGLLDIAEALTVEAGYAVAFKDQVCSALLHHIRAKFLNGQSIGLAERADVDFAWKMLKLPWSLK